MVTSTTAKARSQNYNNKRFFKAFLWMSLNNLKVFVDLDSGLISFQADAPLYQVAFWDLVLLKGGIIAQ